MTEPRVLAVCLTKDRPDMARQAVEAFRRQTYENAEMLILDSSEDPMVPVKDVDAIQVHIPKSGWARPQTIGDLRNAGNSFPSTVLKGGCPDIICHWDDDDWSHPNRIAEQVALLQSSGAEAVGYRQMLFWREVEREAWLYTGAICGTSLCYWRKTWEAHPFPPISDGEDTQFITALKKVKGITAMADEPRLIARIHGQANPAYRPEAMREAAHHWTRVPEWDKYCEGVFSK